MCRPHSESWFVRTHRSAQGPLSKAAVGLGGGTRAHTVSFLLHLSLMVPQMGLCVAVGGVIACIFCNSLVLEREFEKALFIISGQEDRNWSPKKSP